MLSKLKPRVVITKKSIDFGITLPKYTISATAVFWMSLVMSVLATYIFYKLNLIVAYNDARSHMNMARLVIDNLKPGLAQIGSVWLPLNHMLTLTLVWNDWLWQTGLAGAIFSMASYVMACIILFNLLSSYLKNNFVAILGTLVFATNLNILYMQSTPMTEILLLLFFISSTNFLYRWVKSRKLTDFLMLSLSVFLASLTRYDGWFLFIVVAIIVGYVAFTQEVGKTFNNVKTLWSKIEGQVLLFSTLAGFGILLWILWNWAIFNDPLYFAYGPYSARAQQVRIEAAGSLPTEHNLILSFTAYWWAMVNNSGFFLLLFSIIGLLIFIYKKRVTASALAIYTLLIPLFFHVISLYLGHSILILPELGVNVTNEVKGSWFNVRYGLMMLPAVSFFAAYLANKANIAKLILITLLIIEPIMFLSNKNIITITDGVIGTSSLEVGDVSRWLTANTQDNSGLILTSISYNNALAFTSGIHLKRFIHEGTGLYWQTSLADPSIYAKWIVMANGDVGDPIYDALIKKGNSAFLKKYTLRARFKHLNIYERHTVPTGFAYVSDGNFMIDSKQFRFVGANSYDLMYKNPAQINETLSSAKNAGFDVVRFWAFGEGFDTSIQPSPGLYDEDRLKMLDYVLASAKQHNIKVIVTLANYWSDYGGVPQYLRWLGLPTDKPEDIDAFFTNSGAEYLYEEYIKTIILRRNSFTGNMYKDDSTIFAWELMNEPRSSTVSKDDSVVAWIQKESEFVYGLDSSHLISAGSEGFIQDSSLLPQNVGPVITDVGKIENVHFATGHYYLRDRFLVNPGYDHPIIELWKKEVENMAKPLVVEEVGFSKNVAENNGVTRNILYKNLFYQILDQGVDGVVVWNWSLTYDDNFGISPNDPSDQALITLIREYSKKLRGE